MIPTQVVISNLEFSSCNILPFPGLSYSAQKTKKYLNNQESQQLLEKRWILTKTPHESTHEICKSSDVTKYISKLYRSREITTNKISRENGNVTDDAYKFQSITTDYFYIYTSMAEILLLVHRPFLTSSLILGFIGISR